MTRRARFRVAGRLDMASRFQEGTLTIDRGARTIAVRPLRRRKAYELPLDVVAEWICRQVLRVEAARKKAEQKEARRLRRAS